MIVTVKEKSPSTWSQLPQVYKTIATVAVVFVAGMGFGFQVLQITALPARLEVSEAQIDNQQEQIDELRAVTNENARQIRGLICIQRVQAVGGDPSECVLN